MNISKEEWMNEFDLLAYQHPKGYYIMPKSDNIS